MRTPLRSHCWILLLAAAITGCGSDSTNPGDDSGGNPGINIVAGADVTDTVQAALPQALRVVVRDGAGRILPRTVVRFSSVPIARPDGGMAASVYIGALEAPGHSTFLAETTSVDGVAFARILLGNTAGAGAVAIEVPAAGLRDTAHYTISPGAAAKVVLPAADTAIQVGKALLLRGRVVDRNGNARTDAVKYEVAGTGLTVSGDQVSANAPARAAVVARLEGANIPRDTTWVSAVPAATVAIRRDRKLMTTALDGSSPVEIPHAIDAANYDPVWHPGGQSLLAGFGTFFGPPVLFTVGLDGTMQRIFGPDIQMPGGIHSFTYSPDAQWVYFSVGNCNYNAILYRAPIANPNAIERLSPGGMDECFELVNHWPSVSPDGTRVVYENQTWNQVGYSIRVLTIATKSVRELVAGGQRPRWSPAGDLIAYWHDNRIWVVNPDGTGARPISPAGTHYIPGVHWSPDGQWVLGRFQHYPNSGNWTIALINVSTGLELPLPWTTGYGTLGFPMWKP